MRRQNRIQRTLGQSTVTNLTTTNKTETLDLTDAERWEVVVQKETLVRLRIDPIDHLPIFGRPESGGHKRLRLTPREQG